MKSASMEANSRRPPGPPTRPNFIRNHRKSPFTTRRGSASPSAREIESSGKSFTLGVARQGNKKGGTLGNHNGGGRCRHAPTAAAVKCQKGRPRCCGRLAVAMIMPSSLESSMWRWCVSRHERSPLLACSATEGRAFSQAIASACCDTSRGQE